MRIPGDLAVIDNLQRLQAWAEVASLAGIEQRAVYDMAKAFARAVTVPVCGKAVQRLGTLGFDPDGFMLELGSFRFFTRDRVSNIRVELWLPEAHRSAVTVTVSCGDSSVTSHSAPGALAIIDVPVALDAHHETELTLECTPAMHPKTQVQGSNDDRRLGGIVTAVEFS